MNEYKKKNMINRCGTSLIIICPVCGFTFRFFNQIIRKKNQICLMCNYHLEDSKLNLENFPITII